VGSLGWKVVEDGYEFFAKRQLVTLFSAPNYCGEFDNAGGLMSVDESLMCSFQVRVEFKAVMVLPTITQNYCNYPYGNYVGNAPVGKVITLNP